MLFKVQLHFCLTLKVASLTFRLGNRVGSQFTFDTVVFHTIKLSNKVAQQEIYARP